MRGWRRVGRRFITTALNYRVHMYGGVLVVLDTQMTPDGLL